MSIGTNIAVYRKNKGLTQSELGELLGVTNQAVSKWESEVSMPDVMLLPEIAKALGVTLEDLYAENAETTKKEVDDNRIIVVNAGYDGGRVKVRLPVSVVKNIFGQKEILEKACECENEDCDENCEDCKEKSEKNGIGGILGVLEGDFTGTIVDVDDANGQKVQITVERYED